MTTRLLLLVASVVCLVAQSPPDAGFVGRAFPETVIPGVTPTLALTCSIDDYETLGVSKVQSLQLFHCGTNACDEKDNTRLASVHVDSGSVTVTKFLSHYTGYAQASGDISSSRTYLALVWPELLMEYEHESHEGATHEADHSGRYKCMVSAVDETGLHAYVHWRNIDVWGPDHHREV